MERQINRRNFFRKTSLGGLGLLILKDSRAAFSYEANEKLNVALVGVGGRGSWFVGAIPRVGANVVAMCEIEDNDPKRVPSGRLALQVHQGPPMLVQFKDIRLRQF